MFAHLKQRLARISFVFAAVSALALSLAVAPASADDQASIATSDNAALGTILADANGMSLYMYTRDAPGISNCYDQCAANWPPLLTNSDPAFPEGLPGAVGTTLRKDGTYQVTYNGMPLYYWVRDQQPGDTTGQNVGGVWFVVNPAVAPSVQVRQDDQLGPILTDARGMTLYMFTKDAASTSNCYDQCATSWPPLLTTDGPTGPDAVAAGLGVTVRTDGTQQVTYNGMPLYYWFKDANPGDKSGQNVGGVWFVVNPSSATATSSSQDSGY